MLKLYKTQNERVYDKIKALLNVSEIKRTQNGKPYTEESDVHFSVTHTDGAALIAVSDSPVGIDAEKITERRYDAVLKRFSPREQAEINDSTALLKNWVVKEAYIKMLGGTLAHDLKRLEYADGRLLCDGEKVSCAVLIAVCDGIIYAVCTETEQKTDRIILL